MTVESAVGVPEWTQGDRLRKARSLTGLNTRQFAAEIGVSQKTITDAEGDRRSTRRIVLNAYAMRTGVSVEWLITGETPSPDGGPGIGASVEAPPPGLEPGTCGLTVRRSAN